MPTLGLKVQLKQKEKELLRYKVKEVQSEMTTELVDKWRTAQNPSVQEIAKASANSPSATPEPRTSIDLKIKRKSDGSQRRSPRHLATAIQKFNILERLSEDEAEEIKEKNGVSEMHEGTTEAPTAAETATQSSGVKLNSKKHKEVKAFSKRKEQPPLVYSTLGKPPRHLEKQRQKSKSVIGNKHFGI